MNKEFIPHWGDDDPQNPQRVPTNQLNKEPNSPAGFIINCTACGQPIEIVLEQEGLDFVCPSCNAPFTAQPQVREPQVSFQRPIPPPPPPSPPSSQFSRARVAKIAGITLAILVVIMALMNPHRRLKTIANDFISFNEMITDAEANENVRRGIEEARKEGVEEGGKFAKEHGRVPTKFEYSEIYNDNKLKYKYLERDTWISAYKLFKESGVQLDEYKLLGKYDSFSLYMMDSIDLDKLPRDESIKFSEMKGKIITIQDKIKERYFYECLLGFEEGCRQSLALIQEGKSPAF